MYSGGNSAVKADNTTALKFFKKAADMVCKHPHSRDLFGKLKVGGPGKRK